MSRHDRLFCAPILAILAASTIHAQRVTDPDRGQPGDASIQEYLRAETEKIHSRFLEGVSTAADWQERRPRYQRELLYMLGLRPLPEKTPLKATIVRTLEGDGFAVDMLHYQSVPGVYVSGNLYRPPTVPNGKRLPAIFYVCGHTSEGRNGNKTAFQDHGIWFARHGYICLVVDTLQRGEIKGVHWGTYAKQRWWWHSRGYTPAGVECWNGIRGIDYLLGRDDVDADRLAVTGISGGGISTFWITAADDRVRVAVPVSGFADVRAFVTSRIINRHCDCMCFHNAFHWPLLRIAALVAPRPLLFVNSDDDGIFPMDSNERISNNLERLYSLFGASDQIETVVSIGGHAYRKDIRQAVYRFINIHLKNDPRVVTDSEVDLVVRNGSKAKHPIPPEKLRVFPTDADIPEDELNTALDQYFVPPSPGHLPAAGHYTEWRRALTTELRRVSFSSFPERVAHGHGITHALLTLTSPKDPKRLIVLVANEGDGEEELRAAIKRIAAPGDLVYGFYPRGTGPTRWTRRNPPNYVERSLALLGRTADTIRVGDVIAMARSHKQRHGDLPVWTAGKGSAGILAAYAALWEEEDIAGSIVVDPPASHMDDGAPQFLNVLRVCDIPDALGMLAPRSLVLHGARDNVRRRVQAIYRAAGATTALQLDGE